MRSEWCTRLDDKFSDLAKQEGTVTGINQEKTNGVVLLDDAVYRTTKSEG
jgi:hypothetical protein